MLHGFVACMFCWNREYGNLYSLDGVQRNVLIFYQVCKNFMSHDSIISCQKLLTRKEGKQGGCFRSLFKRHVS